MTQLLLFVSWGFSGMSVYELVLFTVQQIILPFSIFSLAPIIKPNILLPPTLLQCRKREWMNWLKRKISWNLLISRCDLNEFCLQKTKMGSHQAVISPQDKSFNCPSRERKFMFLSSNQQPVCDYQCDRLMIKNNIWKTSSKLEIVSFFAQWVLWQLSPFSCSPLLFSIQI